jgi:hypothetical protein
LGLHVGWAFVLLRAVLSLLPLIGSGLIGALDAKGFQNVRCVKDVDHVYVPGVCLFYLINQRV